MLYHSPFLSGYPVFHQPGSPFSLLPIENPSCLVDHPKPTYTSLIYPKTFSGLLLLHAVWLMIFVPIYILLYFMEIDVIYLHRAFQTTQISQHSSLLLFMTSFSNYKLYQYIDVLDLAKSYKDHFLAPVFWNISRNKSPSTIPTS